LAKTPLTNLAEVLDGIEESERQAEVLVTAMVGGKDFATALGRAIERSRKAGLKAST